MGLYAAHASWQRRRLTPLLGLMGILCVALLVASVWPYGSFWGQGSLTAAYEPERFGANPLGDLLNLYVVALPCAVWLAWRQRLNWFWIAGFVATLAALQVWRALGVTFGNRYSLFMGFFAQVVVGQTLGYALMFACRQPLELPEVRRHPSAERILLPALGVFALTGWLWAPFAAQIQQPTARGGAYSARELWAVKSPHAAFHQRFGVLKQQLDATDVVLMSIGRSNFDLVSLTGASVVAAPHAMRVSDAATRVGDVKAFLRPATSNALRQGILDRYRVTAVVLDRTQAALAASLTPLLGPPRAVANGYTLFEVKH
jgi:hypothetical protein